MDVAPNGERVVVAARGDIFTLPAKSGITYNLTRRTSVWKEQMEKLKNQHPDIYEEYTKTTESRTFRIKKEAA